MLEQPAEQDAVDVEALSDDEWLLALALRDAARKHLGRSEGEFWSSSIASAQARALLASDWLAAHDAEVRRATAQRVLREAADAWGRNSHVSRWLRERANHADAIEGPFAFADMDDS